MYSILLANITSVLIIDFVSDLKRAHESDFTKMEKYNGDALGHWITVLFES